MKLINAKVELLTPVSNELLKIVELAGRTCYKSEASITADSAEAFASRMIDNQHGAMLEHASISVRITCDRGVSHELVRHRIASFAQESTRYCNYSKDKHNNEITFIDLEPGLLLEGKEYTATTWKAIMDEWLQACEDSERHYMRMIELGATPQIARSVLNNSLKTEIVVTMNLRNWRHFLKLRHEGITGVPHPQMLEVSNKIYDIFESNLPVLVKDIK